MEYFKEAQPFISVIILDNYDPGKNFINTVKCYANQNYDNYEIILIFWGKNENNDIIKFLNEHNISDTRIKHFAYTENLGYPKGNNIGVNKANGEFILISNPDVELAPDFLRKIVNSFQFLWKKNKTDKLIVGPRVCNYNGIIEYSRRKVNFLGFSNIDISKTNKIRRTMISSGCVFLVKKKHFKELNGFDEYFFMYHDDIDFSIRALKNGIKQYVDNSIRFYHLRSDVDYKLNRFKYFYHERNRILFTLQHSTKKRKMLICQILLEPFHIYFSLTKRFFFVRLKIYLFFIKNIIKIVRNKQKENNLFDRYQDMRGIFNEVNINSKKFRVLDSYVKALYYFYHH